MRVFGFHLCGLDMRQNSDVHEEVVAELLAWAGVHPGLSVRCPKTSGSSYWPPNSAPVGDWSATARRTVASWPASELGVVAAAAHAVKTYGPAAVPNYVISMCQSVSRRLGGRDPAERGWPVRRVGDGAVLPGGHLAAVRDDRRSAQRRDDPARDARTSALPRAGGRARRQRRK